MEKAPWLGCFVFFLKKMTQMHPMIREDTNRIATRELLTKQRRRPLIMHTSSSSSLLSSIIATNRSHSRARAGLKTSISMAFAVGACLLMSGVASAQTPTPLPVTVSLPIDTLCLLYTSDAADER